MRSLLLMILLFGASGASAQALSPADLFARVSPSIVVVEVLDRQGEPFGVGSGVVIGAGRVATNCHVLEEAYAAAVLYSAGRFEARLEYLDVPRDVCTLSVPKLRAPRVSISRTAGLRVGDRIFTIGSPRGLELTLSDGLISSLGRDRDGFIQVTAPISPGSSGGGLFDGQGRLIGLTTFLLKDSQLLNFALPAEWILELASRQQDPLVIASSAGYTNFPPPIELEAVCPPWKIRLGLCRVARESADASPSAKIGSPNDGDRRPPAISNELPSTRQDCTAAQARLGECRPARLE